MDGNLAMDKAQWETEEDNAEMADMYACGKRSPRFALKPRYYYTYVCDACGMRSGNADPDIPAPPWCCGGAPMTVIRHVYCRVSDANGG